MIIVRVVRTVSYFAVPPTLSVSPIHDEHMAELYTKVDWLSDKDRRVMMTSTGWDFNFGNCVAPYKQSDIQRQLTRNRIINRSS